ncbi:MAG: MlaD family protein [Pseudomonadota bacterium]
MQNRANPTLIGLFVLSALLLGIAAIFSLGGDALSDRSSRLILYFEGDVRGLQIGSPVTLRGVKIGLVESMSISYNSKDQTFSIPVIISVDQARLGFKRRYEGEPGRRLVDSLIEQGLRARLYSQSLVTGKMEVELSYQPETPVRLVSQTNEYPEIPTIPSNLEKIASALEELPLDRLVRRVTELLDGIDRMIANSDIPGLVKSLEAVILRLDRITAQLEEKVPQLSTSALALLRDSRAMVDGLQRDLPPLIDEWTQAGRESRELLGRMDAQVTQAVTSWDEALAAGDAAFRQFETTMGSANTLVQADSPVVTELVFALRELSAATRSIRVMAEYLERHPEALLRGKQ